MQPPHSARWKSSVRRVISKHRSIVTQLWFCKIVAKKKCMIPAKSHWGLDSNNVFVIFCFCRRKGLFEVDTAETFSCRFSCCLVMSLKKIGSLNPSGDTLTTRGKLLRSHPLRCRPLSTCRILLHNWHGIEWVHLYGIVIFDENKWKEYRLFLLARMLHVI